MDDIAMSSLISKIIELLYTQEGLAANLAAFVAQVVSSQGTIYSLISPSLVVSFSMPITAFSLVFLFSRREPTIAF